MYVCQGWGCISVTQKSEIYGTDNCQCLIGYLSMSHNLLDTKNNMVAHIL